MKNDDEASESTSSLPASLSSPPPLIHGLAALLDGTLNRSGTLAIAPPSRAGGAMALGHHSHDAWELFSPLRGGLEFRVAGHAPMVVAEGHLLVVPPGCLHMAVDLLPQDAALSLLVMNLPGRDANYGSLRIGGIRDGIGAALSADELGEWTRLAGASPGAIMDLVAQVDLGVPWGNQRALGFIRVLVAAYAEVATRPASPGRGRAGERQVTAALAYLNAHYYEPDLNVANVAAIVGLSASHLGVLFRQIMGQTLHRTLVDIRLRRATDMLMRTDHSIKEIAALTGWNNQLYFSAAYRRHFGKPPSDLRRTR